MAPGRRRLGVVAVFCLGAATASAADPGVSAPPGQDLARGRKVYDFYCYQCHGYSGNAQTQASTYLNPPPRDFTATDPGTLGRERMLAAVRDGRPGTAMVGFANVLGPADIEAVVDFVRGEFMRGGAPARHYHTAENGWPDHERYASAFPFATGEIPIATPWESLEPQQRDGWRLYMRACVSCHDRGEPAGAQPLWQPRALSYPRRHYSQAREDYDAMSGASTFALHDRAPPAPALNASERRGAGLFQRNCAFCHGADGTGRNWIGSFLEPHPRDLTTSRVAAMTGETLREAIRNGLPGTSMPAWKYTLKDEEIAEVSAYIRRVIAVGSEPAPVPAQNPGGGGQPTWQRRQ